MFLFILGSFYTTLDAMLFEDAATLLPGDIVDTNSTLKLLKLKRIDNNRLQFW